MLKILGKKLLQMIPVLLAASIISFMIVYLAPGDPVNMYIRPEMSRQQVEEIRTSLGLDAGMAEQYVRWLGNVMKGNLGNSLVNHQSVAVQIMDKLPATLKLMGVSICLSLLFAVPLGLLSGYRENSKFDKGVQVFSYIGVSIPSFWFAMMLIVLFTLKLGLLPNSGMTTIGDGGVWDQIKHMIMPALALSIYNMAVFTRYIRANVIRELKEEYVDTARAKGLAMSQILIRHVLKNCLIPVIMLLGMNMANLVTGSTIIESIFGWPGMGTLGMSAITSRDYPMVMGVTMLSCLVLLIGNFMADALHAMVDPRIKREVKKSNG